MKSTAFGLNKGNRRLATRARFALACIQTTVVSWRAKGVQSVMMETAAEGQLAEGKRSFWQRNGWLRWVGAGLLVALVGLACVVAVLAHRAEPFLRAQIVHGLQKRFHARVELDSFHIALHSGLHGQWGVWAEGRGLRIWPSDKAEEALGQDERELAAEVARDKPLISVEEFHFHAPLQYKRDQPIVISVVQIQGLDILVPPKANPPANTGDVNAALNQSAPDTSKAAANAASGNTTKGPSTDAGILSDVLVVRVECERANLVMETNKPGKIPLGFAISHMVLTGITTKDPIGFDADLTNPRPLGEIHTTGTFGPWQADDPGMSAVNGDYRFDHADLSGFKGIAGTLNSTGHYQGTLRSIAVDGVTDTPNFELTKFGSPMTLHTSFHATVDGTDGDTWLDPVDATLGQSHFTLHGQVVRLKIADVQGSATNSPDSGTSQAEAVSPFRGGHDIALNLNVDRARIEDFLRLTSHSGSPLLTGAVTVKAKLHIPPGQIPVQERLQLAGNFVLDKALFTSAKIQDRIEQLSLRGQGRPKDVKTTDPATIDSTMKSDFQMAGGVVTLQNLNYSVPGALIQLKGTYGMDGGALDFVGSAKLQATVSEMVGGWKGMLLKPADRFFKKNGAGTEVPIRVGGTREEPTFGIEFDRFKSTSPERPGAK